MKQLRSVNPTSSSSRAQADAAGAALLGLYSADGGREAQIQVQIEKQPQASDCGGRR